MPSIDQMYELRYRREMSEIARALGLNPGKIAEGDALTAILDAISTRRGLLNARAQLTYEQAQRRQWQYDYTAEHRDYLNQIEAERDELLAIVKAVDSALDGHTKFIHVEHIRAALNA